MFFILKKEAPQNSYTGVLTTILLELQKLNLGIGNLNVDLPRFRYAYPRSLPVPPNTLIQVMPRESEGRRLTIKNDGNSKLWILNGVDSPNLSEVFSSPLILQPGTIVIDELDGGYPSWCAAINSTNVSVIAEYQNPQQSDSNEEDIPLQITQLFGTGANFDLAPFRGIASWHHDFVPELGGGEGEPTGFKLFAFSGFTPGKEYKFNLNPGTATFDGAEAYPIDIHLLRFDGFLKAAIWRFIKGNPTLSAGDAMLQLRDFATIAKKHSWIARLPQTGGEFAITPDLSRYLGLFMIKPPNNINQYRETAIFNYTAAEEGSVISGEFVLEGV